MLNQLLISKVRVKMLRYFLFNQNLAIHVRGLVRELNEEINAVRRELRNLESVGLLSSKQNGNKLDYRLNLNAPGIQQLYEIFAIEEPDVKLLRTRVMKLEKLTVTLLTPNFFTKKYESENDVDMLIVAETDPTSINSLIKDLEVTMKRELRVAALKNSEVPFYLKKRDPMLMNILSKDTINLIGSPASLYRI